MAPDQWRKSMHVNELPFDSDFCGIAVDFISLSEILEKAARDNGGYFLASEPIEESRLSGRIFHLSPPAKQYEFPFPRPFSGADVANHLVCLTPESRYSTLSSPQERRQKAWEIRKAPYNGRTIVIALAQWMEI